jgi:class III poly(R)-hydroxyalkanoic acid synthase PhaE subunit
MTDWPKNEWMDQWQALSRQYWNAFQDLTREAGTAAGNDPAAMPWHEGFEQWARMFGGAGKQGETIERVLASAKSFTAFAQSMIAAATAGGHGAMPNWADALRNGFKMPSGSASMFANPVAHALREISGQGVKGFEQMMEGFKPYLDPMREAKSWLGVPAFGFLREHQEHYQKMAVALIDYQEQTSRYNALIMKASQRGFELFESKLAAREEPGRQIDSLRALYDLWVDAAEEAYAEIALSPEFREVYGALVNSQMRVRSQFQQEVERISTDFGMPTRSELDSIGQRLHDLRREVRNGAAGDSSALAREVESLRREVAELKAAIRNGAARSGSAPRASAAAPKPIKHKRPRPSGVKKRTPPVAALRANLKESVSSESVKENRPREKKVAAPRARAKTRTAVHVQRPKSPPRTKKSVAKVAHSPSRVGKPVVSFAERIATFARAAHRKHPEARPASGKHATVRVAHLRVASAARRVTKLGGR